MPEALAAALTPLRPGGDAIDEAALEAVARYLKGARLPGILALGTTGEGILLSSEERRRVLRRFLAVQDEGFHVFAHCGAQTTLDTERLAADAADAGAHAVAVICPPYFALSEREMAAHLASAARACAPCDFYVYEFAARSGYAIPPELLERLRGDVENLVGLKVSDTPWERFEPYLLQGLKVYVGNEGLISRALRAGAEGTVSGLAAALPDLVLRAVQSGQDADSARCAAVRTQISAFPFQSALKVLLARRGVPLSPDVRRPLTTLSAAEATQMEALADEILGTLSLDAEAE